MLRRAVVLFALILAAGLSNRTSSLTWAAPPLQGPAEEPTKAPYIFPTPIFIPTYPDDNLSATATPPRTGDTPPVSKPAQGERTYRVVQGDNAWIIAQKVYGSGAKYKIILEANGLKETSVFKVGTVLRIPAVDAAGKPILINAPMKPTTTIDRSSIVPTAPISTTVPITVSNKQDSKSAAGEQSMAELIINILALLFLGGSLLLGGFALVYYRRSARIKKLETLAKRVRSTK